VTRWEKRGIVFCPDGSLWWARSHAHLPTPQVLDDETVRIFFAGLDEHSFGRIGYVDVDVARTTPVVRRVGTDPVLDLGPRGTFDDSGVNPSCVVETPEGTRLYYIGWQRSARVPYQLFAGLATAPTGSTSFARFSPVPVLDRTAAEPFLRSATTVLPQGDGYRVWYVSAHGWTDVNGRAVPTYGIWHARSADGLAWEDARPAVGLQADEYGLGRPWVVQDGETFRMWYSIRSRSRPYRIGYAESADGYEWTRRDGESGIRASESGWDSEMICYPCVVDVPGRRLLFYNGNRHGESGFGMAEAV